MAFVHGHTPDSRLWRSHVRSLPARYTVVTYDMRDYGGSEAPPSGYRPPVYAEDLGRQG